MKPEGHAASLGKALLAHRGNPSGYLTHGLHDTHLAICKLHRDKLRGGANGRAQALRVNAAVCAHAHNHGAARLGTGEDGLVLGGIRHHAPVRCSKGEVVGLGGASGEDDAIWLGAHEVRNVRPRSLNGISRRAGAGVRGRGVLEAACEVGLHGREDPGV